MKIEIKKITERIKNIIELKCNIDLDWKYALKRTNHARVYETSFVHTSQVTWCTRVNKILSVDTQYTAKVKNL